MTKRNRLAKTFNGEAAAEVAAVLATCGSSLVPIEHSGQRIKGFLVDARVTSNRQGYNLILITTQDRIISGKCQIKNSRGQVVEGIGKTERVRNANRITIRVSIARE